MSKKQKTKKIVNPDDIGEFKKLVKKLGTEGASELLEREILEEKSKERKEEQEE